MQKWWNSLWKNLEVSQQGVLVVSSKLWFWKHTTVVEERESHTLEFNISALPGLNTSEEGYSTSPIPNVEQKFPVCVGREKKKQTNSSWRTRNVPPPPHPLFFWPHVQTQEYPSRAELHLYNNLNHRTSMVTDFETAEDLLAFILTKIYKQSVNI